MERNCGAALVSARFRDVRDLRNTSSNPQRKHVTNGMLSPIEFEQWQKLKMQGV
jgi:putative transposase